MCATHSTHSGPIQMRKILITCLVSCPVSASRLENWMSWTNCEFSRAGMWRHVIWDQKSEATSHNSLTWLDDFTLLYYSYMFHARLHMWLWAATFKSCSLGTRKSVCECVIVTSDRTQCSLDTGYFTISVFWYDVWGWTGMDVFLMNGRY